MELFSAVVYILIGIASLAFLYIRQRNNYWARRGILHDTPHLIYGNVKGIGKTRLFRDPFREVYRKYKGQAPFCGFYLLLRRAVVILDLELAKQVLIKDFTNFAHRGQYYNERDDPLSAHVFNLDGPKWRSVRNKLSPTFTSGKMKFMFPALIEVAERFIVVMGEMHDAALKSGVEVSIEVKELLARFTTDVIGSCAFGLDCNSLKDPETQFRIMGKKVFTKRRHGALIFSLMNAFPDFCRKLGLKTVPDDVNSFFMGVVRDTVAYREREGVQRNDFMNLLIELKNRNEAEGLTLEEIAAQAFVFFLAGFETSSSTMGFCLYELALNPDIQQKARTEVNEMLERHEGKFTYEGMRELKYLQQILHETMRLYSIASFVSRKTINDYLVPNTKHIIEKGTIIIVPVDAIHMDPEIYPEPEVFNPDRFEPQEVEKRHAMAWLPFGEGPRNCIGLRFGEMQAIVGLALLLKNFRFSAAKETKIPIQISAKSFILASEGGIILNVERI